MDFFSGGLLLLASLSPPDLHYHDAPLGRMEVEYHHEAQEKQAYQAAFSRAAKQAFLTNPCIYLQQFKDPSGNVEFNVHFTVVEISEGKYNFKIILEVYHNICKVPRRWGF